LELLKRIAALVKAANKWLGLLMYDLVGANIRLPSECPPTGLTLVWSLVYVALLMSLKIRIIFRSGERG
jgi:hypothetical protein